MSESPLAQLLALTSAPVAIAFVEAPPAGVPRVALHRRRCPAVVAGVRRKMNLEQWAVGGRGFGLVLTFLLMAGEVYTTFSFLGASGFAYPGF